jgi:hypothetical protein
MERNPNTHRITDHYVALDTKEEAKGHYNLILSKPETYSVNLTEVLESTDHTPKKRPKKARYWVIQNIFNQAFIMNQKPVLNRNGVKKIHWSGFSEREADFQLRNIDRIISLCD